MATTTTITALIHLLLTLSITIHARESQFFAKFSNFNPQETKPLNTNQENPTFIPQSQEDDSFGHESGQLPPSATANLPENYNPVAYTTPIHSNTQEFPNEFNYEQEGSRYNGESTMYNSEKQGMSDTRFLENGRYYYGVGDGYKSGKQGFEDARFMENEGGGDMYKSVKQEESGRYNSQMQGMGESKYSTTNNANMYNPEKQGMSDTRFLENGKYFYDLNMENVNTNGNMNSRGFNARNEYNTQGYYGNNENSYDRYNSNGGYENQEEFQGEQFNP